MTVNVLWLLFRSDSFSQWKEIMYKILCLKDTSVSDGLIEKFSITETILLEKIGAVADLSLHIRGFWMHMAILVAFLICLLPENNYRKMLHNSRATMMLAAAAFVIAFLELSRESVFVYWNF